MALHHYQPILPPSIPYAMLQYRQCLGVQKKRPVLVAQAKLLLSLSLTEHDRLTQQLYRRNILLRTRFSTQVLLQIVEIEHLKYQQNLEILMKKENRFDKDEFDRLTKLKKESLYIQFGADVQLNELDALEADFENFKLERRIRKRLEKKQKKEAKHDELMQNVASASSLLDQNKIEKIIPNGVKHTVSAISVD